MEIHTLYVIGRLLVWGSKDSSQKKKKALDKSFRIFKEPTLLSPPPNYLQPICSLLEWRPDTFSYNQLLQMHTPDAPNHTPCTPAL